MLLDGENKREWGLEQSGVLVSERFFCSCSLQSFFLASILGCLENDDLENNDLENDNLENNDLENQVW